MSSPTLKGAKIFLRPTQLKDLDFLQHLWNDGEVMRYVGYPHGLGIDEQGMREWFRRLEEHRAEIENIGSSRLRENLSAKHTIAPLANTVAIGLRGWPSWT